MIFNGDDYPPEFIKRFDPEFDDEPLDYFIPVDFDYSLDEENDDEL